MNYIDWEEIYKKETGRDTTYEPGNGYNTYTYYTDAYVEWLEDKLSKMVAEQKETHE